MLIAVGSGTIGRAPRAARPGEVLVVDPAVLTVTDVTRTVSKAHLAYEIDASGVWFTDLGSTNGSILTTPDGVTVELIAGAAVLAAYGSTVMIGDLSFALARSAQDDQDADHTIQLDRG